MAPKSTQLLRYLTSIQDARPINFSAFLKCLPYEYAQNWQKHFQVAMVAPQKWVVTCTGDVLDQLLLMAQPTQDRAHAASVGDSHRHGNDISFLLVYHEGCADPRPDTVVVTPDGWHQASHPKPRALIVENEFNFFRCAEMLDIVSGFVSKPLSLTNTDVILGSGDRIAGEIYRPWLNQYQQIFCAFDYDLAGLHNYASLQRNLKAPCRFVQPKDWTAWYWAFRKPYQKSGVAAVNLANQLGFASLAQALIKTGHFMEQEMLLRTPSQDASQ